MAIAETGGFTAMGPAFVVLLLMLMFVAVILGAIFWVFMLVDAAKREFQDPNDKVVWVLVIALIGVIGAVIYYFAIKRGSNCCEKINKTRKQVSKKKQTSR